ncbi:MAG: gliding motility-associated ABC transporter substrate-binding protein GldG [Bacteroidota bacterium]|nr:gliding motility-associated ABC transporter substrate-binding protein GldG [Bacteroidota bacterium]
MVKKVSKKTLLKRQNIIQLILSLAIIFLINYIGSFWFSRIDLTAEKRYSLSPATINMLKKLDDIVYFKVYLEGDFPAGFKRLRNETKEMLNQFRAYSKNIEYEFINPSESPDKKTRNSIYRQLYMKGLDPTNLQTAENGGRSEKIIFPGAIVTYKEREVPVQLLLSQMGVSSDQVLNNSVQSLEYSLASAIRKLSTVQKPKIGFIEGHGELGKIEVEDIAGALSEYYSVSRVNINHKLNSLKDYKSIIIAKPDSIFDDKDKFIIDQFIMKGGKVLWLIDPVFASMDSLRNNNTTVGVINTLNLEDMLFRYGVRLNTNLILDMQSVPIPVVTGQMGNQPQQSLLPWYYFPVLTPSINHPIVNNLNAVRTEFISSIDTVGAKGIKKTILLTSSKYSKVVNTPAIINLEILRKKPDPSSFNKSYIPVAVLLEGKFHSIFANRLTPEIMNNPEIGFKNISTENKMIVIADGDIIKNQVYVSNGKKVPYPLGYDKYTKHTFGNKDLILNAMNYLCDDSGLISARSKELKLRLLDKSEISDSGLFWQIINIIIPIVLIIGFGIYQTTMRKRKYST